MLKVLPLFLLAACGPLKVTWPDEGDDGADPQDSADPSGDDTDEPAEDDTDDPPAVENQAPSEPEVAIYPENPTQLSELSCAVVAESVDPDGDDVSYRYQWYRDGVLTGEVGSTLPEELTMRGETWTCQVVATDGQADSDDAEASATLGMGFTTFDAGDYHNCAIVAENRGETGPLYCWGRDGYGEGGEHEGAFASVEAGYYLTCALDAAGTPSCWGTVSWGMNMPSSGPFSSLSLGDYHGCGITLDDELECWGFVPSATPPSGMVTAIAIGEYDSCALRPTTNTITCWGQNNNGEADVPYGQGAWKALDGNYHSFCGLNEMNGVACWGMGEFTDLPASGQVAVSVHHTGGCSLSEEGAVTCWGYDSPLVDDAPAGSFAQIAVGSKHACALDDDGRATCWGEELGYGATESPNAP